MKGCYKIYFDINVLLDYTLQRSSFNEVEIIMKEIEKQHLHVQKSTGSDRQEMPLDLLAD